MADDEEIEFLVAIENQEIVENLLENNNVPRKVFKYINCFNLSDNQFKKFFRLTKDIVRRLVDLLRPYIRDKTRSSAIPIDSKIFIALNFFATGSYQLPVGATYNIQASPASVSRSIHEVIDALNQPEILNEFIRFPRDFQEINQVRQQFFDKFGMPGVIGCVDGTHIAIVPPSNAEAPENVYVNRKSYHSINTQLICDAQMKIIHVNARYPGSCNDRFIWQNTNVEEILRNIYNRGHQGYFLLGDSGYMLRPWLLIPLENPHTAAEERYNHELCRIRSLIERCIGILKMRFRCLLKDRVLHYSPTTASKIINACVVLHNQCITENIELEEVEEDLDFGLFVDQPPAVNHPIQNPYLQAGRFMQRRVINLYEAWNIA